MRGVVSKKLSSFNLCGSANIAPWSSSLRTSVNDKMRSLAVLCRYRHVSPTRPSSGRSMRHSLALFGIPACPPPICSGPEAPESIGGVVTSGGAGVGDITAAGAEVVSVAGLDTAGAGGASLGAAAAVSDAAGAGGSSLLLPHPARVIVPKASAIRRGVFTVSSLFLRLEMSAGDCAALAGFRSISAYSTRPFAASGRMSMRAS